MPLYPCRIAAMTSLGGLWVATTCIACFVSASPLHSNNHTNFADVECGSATAGLRPHPYRRHGRVVGGVETAPGEFPWIVSLTRSGGHFCGGALVNKRWVLTAGHCLCSGTVALGTSSLRAVVGDHDLLAGGDPTLPVSQLVFHPDFRCGSYVADVALLRLEGEVEWSPAVRPACFPSPGDQPLPKEAATVAGWGWTDESPKGIRSNVLLKTNVEVIDNALCAEWFHGQGKKVNLLDNQMCAGLEQGGRDACSADSGGPLMDAGFRVVGVVSTGVGCGRPRLPGVYSRVAEFLQWIKDTC